MAGRDPAFDLMELAGKRPEYQQMMDYLMSRRSVPPVQLNYLGGNVAGVFEYPGVTVTSRTPSGPNGRITVDDYRGVSTLVHETAHATQRQLAHQYGEEKYGPWMSTLPATPFTDAYDKMRLHKGPGTANPLEVLAPKWKQAEADYRSTFQEAQAFGLANSAMPEQANQPGPPHVDATLATEFLILLDLATRSQKAKPQSQGR
jgi:hypothetical protein